MDRTIENRNRLAKLALYAPDAETRKQALRDLKQLNAPEPRKHTGKWLPVRK